VSLEVKEAEGGFSKEERKRSSFRKHLPNVFFWKTLFGGLRRVVEI
jgi:hypothetical protein